MGNKTILDKKYAKYEKSVKSPIKSDAQLAVVNANDDAWDQAMQKEHTQKKKAAKKEKYRTKKGQIPGEPGIREIAGKKRDKSGYGGTSDFGDEIDDVYYKSYADSERKKAGDKAVKRQKNVKAKRKQMHPEMSKPKPKRGNNGRTIEKDYEDMYKNEYKK